MGAYQVYHIQLPSDCVQIRVWIVFGPVPVIEFGDTSDVARRVGMTRSIMALGAQIEPPISGAINSKTGGFDSRGGKILYRYVAQVELDFSLIFWER